MVNHKRRKRLLKLLAENQAATVQQLVEWLNASPARSGATSAGWPRATCSRAPGAGREPAAEETPSRCRAKPSRTISSATHRASAPLPATRSMCTDGETIIINGGTTTFMMAEFLADRSMPILTNSFLMAERLLVKQRRTR
jgi:DeoR family ulaG and ulaABCDEF operon transcriptional repressor